MRVYKLNLLLVNSRYGDLEQRVIRKFITSSATSFWWFAEMEILLSLLIEDGLLLETGESRSMGNLVQKEFVLTKKGHEYISQWPRE